MPAYHIYLLDCTCYWGQDKTTPDHRGSALHFTFFWYCILRSCDLSSSKMNEACTQGPVVRAVASVLGKDGRPGQAS